MDITAADQVYSRRGCRHKALSFVYNHGTIRVRNVTIAFETAAAISRFRGIDFL